MTKPVRYEFRLAEPVSERAACAFPELVLVTGSARNVLHGRVRDQSQLYGLLARFQTLGLTLVELRRLAD
ncbi:MAG: hypothetical protein ACRDN9_20305 [Streptosporangiaceae bacterium]